MCTYYLVFQVRKPHALPQWMSLVTAFPSRLWAAVGASAVAALAFAGAYAVAHPQAEAEAAVFVVNLVGMFVDESQPIMKRLRCCCIALLLLLAHDLIVDVRYCVYKGIVPEPFGRKVSS